MGVFHSVGGTIAKPRLSMAFLGRTEERESRFPRVRLLILIKDDGLGEFDSLESNKIIFEQDMV